MSPVLGATTLEAAAALARVDGAGTLPDPTFRIELEDIDRARGGVLPRKLNRIDYTVEQEFPLWGKRDLARGIATAGAARLDAERERVLSELHAEIKRVFAAYFSASEAERVVADIRRTLTVATEVGQKRYEQGLGSQQDAIMLRIEAATIDTALARKAGERRRAAARLNTLLNRPADAPLAAPEALPAVPAGGEITLAALVERAALTNPMLKAQDAAVSAASSARTLVDKSWYPDVAVGLSVVDQSRRWQGYEVMVSLKIPLNAAQRRAEASAATAEIGAARNRREAIAADIRGGLEASLWGLKEAREVAALLYGSHIPQADLALSSALAGYAQNTVAGTVVLDAVRHVLQNKLEHLAAMVEQQNYLAEIERLIGGPL